MTTVESATGLFGVPNKYYEAAENTVNSCHGRQQLLLAVAQAIPLLPFNTIARDCEFYTELDFVVDAIPNTISSFLSMELFSSIRRMELFKTLSITSGLVLDGLVVVGALAQWGLIELGSLAASMGSFQVFGVSPFATVVQFSLLQVTVTAFAVFLLFKLVETAFAYKKSVAENDALKSKEHTIGVVALTTKIAQQVFFLAGGAATSMAVYAVFGVVAASFSVLRQYVHELGDLELKK